MKYLLLLLFIIFFQGCVGLIAFAGTTASAVSASQEVEEEYGGSVLDYAYDKADKMYKYVQKKANN